MTISIEDFEYIYKIYTTPYPNKPRLSAISRPDHGVTHVTRAAIYGLVFATFYQRYQNPDALMLNEEDITLLQLSLLFHDAGRKGDGVDLWDKDSAALLYHYLVNQKKCSEEKAKQCAEAVANKDAKEGEPYNKLVITTTDEITWESSSLVSGKKNIYQKIIHDADCLDVMRVRANFDHTYLDFYQNFAKSNPQAFSDLAELIVQARSLLAYHGDSRLARIEDVRIKYEVPDCYKMTCDLVINNWLGDLLAHPHKFRDPALPLYALSIAAEPDTITADYLNAMIRQGIVLARGISHPAKLNNKHNETNVGLELYKASRQLGVPTRSKKASNTTKEAAIPASLKN